MAFILGSGSPRRRELLAQLGIAQVDVQPPDIDETPRESEKPRDYCKRIAAAKLSAIPAKAGDIVLCADTTVAVGRRILGKPDDISEAEAFLRLMSGRRHKVITAVAVKNHEKSWCKDVVSTVKMRSLERMEIKAYLQTDEWQGKAGGYAIQGYAARFIPWIEGSYSGIVGLPLAQTHGLLRAAGYPFGDDNEG